ncbi:MAG: hypothetical protein BWZ03_00102 [bacterium ADurb.BinA186]|nr:MAG: hypothetical protein BWZ03_00102 [bacterium ADurb.BinA186]
MADKPYEWARALMRNSVEYAKKFPDKDFVGLSINANGDAKEAAIDEILRSAPEGAKFKLSKALEAGITTVRVVSKIDEAISCDLVTEAGAGGRIIKMLEAENMNKEEMKKEAEKEIEKKEADKKEASPMDEKKEADGDAAPDHSDVAADKALILDMLKKLGLIGDGVSEEAAYCQTKEAIEAACSEGASKEEAMEMAGKAMKMAKIMHAQKQKKEAAKVEEAKKESDDKDADDKKEEKKKEETKESEILKLKGENAKLKESIGKIEMEKHLDKILRESGFKMEVTKAFRKAIGEPKSIKDIDEKFKVFSLGVRESVSSEADGYEFLGMSPEKSVMVESDKSSVDLSDC